jgi:hypothetical protein
MRVWSDPCNHKEFTTTFAGINVLIPAKRGFRILVFEIQLSCSGIQKVYFTSGDRPIKPIFDSMLGGSGFTRQMNDEPGLIGDESADFGVMASDGAKSPLTGYIKYRYVRDWNGLIN